MKAVQQYGQEAVRCLVNQQKRESLSSWVSNLKRLLGAAGDLDGTSEPTGEIPLQQIQLIPTGGVSLSTAEGFLAAGAFALGIGSDLVDAKAAAEGRTDVITENARKYIGIVHKFRGVS